MAVPEISVYDIHPSADESFRVVRFMIPGGVTSPGEFASAVESTEDSISGQFPVLINGRGPVWGYGMLIHAAHATPAVAVYDPRMAGYVVIQTHNERFALGQVIPANEPQDMATP